MATQVGKPLLLGYIKYNITGMCVDLGFSSGKPLVE